jgi:hypothetical protein
MNYQESYNNFIKDLATIGDPLLLSLFKQFTVKAAASKYLILTMHAKLYFLTDLIEQTSNLWTPLLLKSFPAMNTVQFELEDGEIKYVKIISPTDDDDVV